MPSPSVILRVENDASVSVPVTVKVESRFLGKEITSRTLIWQ